LIFHVVVQVIESGKIVSDNERGAIV